MWIDGYDSKGRQVASTLVSETQPGHIHLDGMCRPEPAQSSRCTLTGHIACQTCSSGQPRKESRLNPAYAEGQVLEVAIEPALRAFIAEGIRLEEVIRTVGVLDHQPSIRTWHCGPEETGAW